MRPDGAGWRAGAARAQRHSVGQVRYGDGTSSEQGQARRRARPRVARHGLVLWLLLSGRLRARRMVERRVRTVLWCREGPVRRRDLVGAGRARGRARRCQRKPVSHDAGSCGDRACPGAGGDGRGPAHVERSRGGREGGVGRSRSVGERGGGAREARRPWCRRAPRYSCSNGTATGMFVSQNTPKGCRKPQFRDVIARGLLSPAR